MDSFHHQCMFLKHSEKYIYIFVACFLDSISANSCITNVWYFKKIWFNGQVSAKFVPLIPYAFLIPLFKSFCFVMPKSLLLHVIIWKGTVALEYGSADIYTNKKIYWHIPTRRIQHMSSKFFSPFNQIHASKYFLKSFRNSSLLLFKGRQRSGWTDNWQLIWCTQ